MTGGRSTACRNAHVAELMDTGFELERLRDRGQPIQVAQAFFEQRGFGVSTDNSTAPVVYASADDDGDEDGATALAYTAAPAPPPVLAARMAVPVVQAELAPAPDLTATLNGARPSRRTTTSTPPRATPAAPPAGRWSVQVGAFRDETVARDWLVEVNRRFRSQFATAERSVQTAAGWYRSRFTGLTEDGAQAACAALAERRVTCMVVRPE